MRIVLIISVLLSFAQHAHALCLWDPADPSKILHLFEGQDAAVIGVPYEQAILKSNQNGASANQIPDYGENRQTALYKVRIQQWLIPSKTAQSNENIMMQFVLGYASDNPKLNTPYMILLKKTESGWTSNVCLIREAAVAAQSIEVLKQASGPAKK